MERHGSVEKTSHSIFGSNRAELKRLPSVVSLMHTSFSPHSVQCISMVVPHYTVIGSVDSKMSRMLLIISPSSPTPHFLPQCRCCAIISLVSAGLPLLG